MLKFPFQFLGVATAFSSTSLNNSMARGMAKLLMAAIAWVCRMPSYEGYPPAI
jgi:hypothetical protein